MSWRVDSFHVNVGNGDCSIHVLVWSNNSGDHAYRCVLMDSGSARSALDPGTKIKSWNPLDNMIQWLTKRYFWDGPYGNGRAQFDSIVITHWDEDHYGQLLWHISQTARPKPANAPQLLSFLKYTGGNAAAPSTVLYAPNWKAGSRLNGPANWTSYVRAEHGLVQGQFFGSINVKYNIWGQSQTSAVQPVWIRFCILQIEEVEPWSVLGVEFFFNTRTGSAKGSLEQMYTTNPAGNNDKHPDPKNPPPGLYCVGAMQRTAGQDPPSHSQTTMNSFLQLQGMVDVVKEDPTNTNRASLAAVVYWPDTGRVSQYLAGDMDQDNEDNLLAWLQTPSNGPRQINTVKISHHGSKSSTPFDLLSTTGPTNIILSIPSSRHIHPSWEIMWYIYLHMILVRASGNSTPINVLGTKYPHVFATKVVTTGPVPLVQYLKTHRISLDAFKETGPHVGGFNDYWTWIVHAITLINNNTSMPGPFRPLAEMIIARYEGLDVNKYESDMQGVLLYQLERIWRAIAHPGATSHPSVGVGQAHNQAITETNQIDAIAIGASSSTDIVKHKYRLVDDLKAYEPQSQPSSSYAVESIVANQSAGPTDFFMHPFDPNEPIPNDEAAIITDPANYPDPDESDINEGPDIALQEILDQWSLEDLQEFLASLDPASDSPGSFSGGFLALAEAVAAPPLEASDDGSFVLFASRVDKTKIKVQSFTQLTKGTSLDGFVSTLHCANLCLDGPPASGTAVSTTSLSPSDEFGAYVCNALGAQDPMSVLSASNAVTGFSIGVVDSRKNAFLFTTDAVAKAFGLTTLPTTQGILPGANMMILGLDTSVWTGETTPSDLGTLLTFARLGNFKANALLSALLQLVTSDLLNLTIAKDSAGRRNAIWFDPLESYRTTTRLEADFSQESQDALQTYLGKVFPGIKVQDAMVIAKHMTNWSPAQSSTPSGSSQASSSGAAVTHSGSLTILGTFVIPTPGGSNPTASFEAAIELDPGHTKLSLVSRSTNNILADMFEVFAKILGFDKGQTNWGFEDWFGQEAGPAHSTLEMPVLRRISIVLDDDKGTPSISNLQIDLETRVNSGGAPVALFLITYTWDKGAGAGSALTASLWPDIGDQSSLNLLPGYESFNSLAPPVTLGPKDPWPEYLDLTRIGSFSGLPSEIPSRVTQAVLHLNSVGISFEGAIRAGDPPTGGYIPPVSLGELQLSVGYCFRDNTNDYASLLMRAMINPPPADPASGVASWKGSPAQILGQVSYENQTWKLLAQVHGLYGSTLHDFFDKGSQSAIGTMLDNLEIVDLGIEYDYGPSSSGVSNLTIWGNILIDKVTLVLDFNYSNYSTTKSWEFSTTLDTTQDPGSTTVGKFLGTIFGHSTVQQDLPDFVSSIPITPPKSSQAAGFDMVSLAPSGSNKDAQGNDLFFTAWLSYTDVSLWVIQYQEASPSQGAPRPPPRRVFVLTVNAFPEAVDIPLVGKLRQPFDEMVMVYVQPQSTDAQYNGAITRKDMTVINSQLQNKNRPALPYRETKNTQANPPTIQDSDILLSPGAHFLLLRDDGQGQQTVVLDYAFHQSGESQSADDEVDAFVANSNPDTGGAVVPVSGGSTSDPPSGSPQGSAKAPYEKKIGPLTIRNIGFKFTAGKSPVLSITLDASVQLGPIVLDMLGFSLDLTFTPGKNLLNALPTPGFSLTGLAAAFDSPPAVMAGMLEHVTTPGNDYFEGGATISFNPWLFTADAYYGTKKDTGGNPYTTAFVYFALEGPIISLEFGEINKIMGGFGYNTGVKRPDPTNVASFPLLADPSQASSDPSQALDSLLSGSWFYPQPNAYWVAAGLGIKAFEMLQAQLVVVVEWDPAVTLGLYGIMTADLPSSGPKIAHIELGIVANVDFAAGTLQMSGQLAPSSFVLDPACHLTGGFAYYQWFGSGPDSGDFVFTVGGYHRSFVPPAQYPNPPRLAISWAFDSSLTITGESYLAITPNVCMAGGRLDASLSLGPLSAWFDAFADMLINYKPFWFQAQGGLSVGVAFTLDLWICTIHINVEIGATLYLEGPPFAGTVHVDFWVFGFSINFGEQSGDRVPKALILSDFYNQVLQTDLAASSAPVVPHIFSCNNGLIPQGNNTKSDPNDPETPWVVRGAVFQFTVSCKFAIDSATVTTEGLMEGASGSPFAVLSNGQSVYARPMQLQEGSPLKSELDITIARASNPKEQDSAWNVGAPVVTSVPNALWGVCTLFPPLPLSI
jgi:hypothetical protein